MDWVARASEIGFERVAAIEDASSIVLSEKLAASCSPKTCPKYASCWSCPPGAGSFEELKAHFEGKTGGVIVQTVREHGVMNAMICDEPPEDLIALRAYRVSRAVPSVTGRLQREYPAEGLQKHRVALMDYGVKLNIIRSLQRRGCHVTVWPAATKAEEVLSSDPDGIVLSNGPGDPKDNPDCICEIRKMLGVKPVFGICLGHQLTAIALGGDTAKLKYGHRGGNQPVKDVKTGRVWTTSQNHGYAVLSDSLKGIGNERFINANDGSCEGFDYLQLRCFTVQFHPEACPGPSDTGFLFDRFIEMMGA